MADVGGKNISDADRKIISEMMSRTGEAEKNISDADRSRLNQLLKIIIQRSAEEKQGKAEAGAVSRGNAIAREEALENSDMDLGIVPQGMMYGGKATKRKVQKYKGGGCVMAGRGMKNTKMS